MDSRIPTLVGISLAGLLFFGGLIFLGVRFVSDDETAEDPQNAHPSPRPTPSSLGKNRSLSSAEARSARDAIDDALELEALKRLLRKEGAIPNEAVLRFNSADDFNRFLQSATRKGLDILGAQPRSNTVRFRYDDLGDVRSTLSPIDRDDYELGANFAYIIPDVPDPGTLQNPGQRIIPFGDNVLAYLGITTDNSAWGEGVTIAILDTGVEAHSTFRSDQVKTIDFLETNPIVDEIFGHGTAVASLAAGNSPGAAGIAPASDILSYAVTNSEGVSDSFTLSEAIYDAVARRADIINISLGSLGDSFLLRDAVSFAIENGVAIVAAAGNNGIDQLTYPAAYAGVVSAGAIDAFGQRLYYSNAGETLSLSAPGAGVSAAWPGDEIVSFSGTSASSPYVAGAIAAVMSLNPGITALDAEALLYEYANEAGRPGIDPLYGNGILDVGRVLEKDTPGIFDVAIASQTFADPSVPTNNTNPFIDVAVQNVGTETLFNVSLKVDSSGTIHTFQFPRLNPGQVGVHQAPVSSARARVDGSVRVLSTASLSSSAGQDRNPRDNSQATLIYITTPEENAGL